MKILRLRDYYDPEKIASSHLSDDLDEAYRKNEIYCVNITPMPTRGVTDDVRRLYRNRKNEVSSDGFIIVHRFSMVREKNGTIQRFARYMLCSIAQYFKGKQEKNIDVILGGSTPPTQGALCALVRKKLEKKSKKKIPIIYNLQDIFPDSMVTAGMTHKGSLIWKIGRKMENYTYRNADRIITISESMKRNIMEKGVPEEKVTVISNWIDTDTVFPVDKADNPLFEEFGISREKFTVLYAGNLGAAQGADVILQAAELLKEEREIQFVIFGGGAEYEAAVKSAENTDNVFIHPLLPVERVSQVYSMGDVALITCKKGVGAAGMPSKTWSIMACNTPVIAAFDTVSDLADTLKTAGAGCCVEPEDPDALADAVRRAYTDWKKNGKKQIDSRSFVLENASKTVCVGKYIDLIRECVGEKP